MAVSENIKVAQQRLENVMAEADTAATVLALVAGESGSAFAEWHRIELERISDALEGLFQAIHGLDDGRPVLARRRLGVVVV